MRPTAKIFEVELDRPRKLQFNLLAQMRFQEARGHNLMSALKPVIEFAAASGADSASPATFVEILALIDPADLAALIWCALGSEDERGFWRPDEDLSLEQVASQLDFGRMLEIWSVITGAIESSVSSARKRPSKKRRPTKPAKEPAIEPIS